MPKGPSTQRMRVGAPREESPALHVAVGDGTSPKLSNPADLGAAGSLVRRAFRGSTAAGRAFVGVRSLCIGLGLA
mgnify:CR=1 FL=1